MISDKNESIVLFFRRMMTPKPHFRSSQERTALREQVTREIRNADKENEEFKIKIGRKATI